MARRERERYTERARPNRKQAASPGESTDAGSSSLSNPAVLVAIAGLVIALGMAAGFLWSRNDAGTADGADPVDDAAETVADEGAEPAEADEAEDAAAQAPEEAAPPPPAPDLDAGGAYDAPEDQGLEPETTAYFATIETPKGPIELELFPDVAPQHVNAFVFLSREGFYDGLTFHRVEPGFVIQGGDPDGVGTGGPGYTIPAEFNTDDPVPHRVGTLAMARSSDPNSGGSQFYIVLADGPGPSSLDGNYTVFGHVIDGMDAALAIERGDTMDRITISEKPIEERVVSPDDIRAGNLPETIQ